VGIVALGFSNSNGFTHQKSLLLGKNAASGSPIAGRRLVGRD